MLVLVLLLVSCGKSPSTGNVTKKDAPVTPTATPPADKPVETTPAPAAKPIDTQKIGVEAAASFEAKYCNYKYGALNLQINGKRDEIQSLENQKGKDGTFPTGTKEALAKANEELQGVQKNLDSLQGTCKQSKFGDQCSAFQKEVQSNIDMIQGELKDDQVSLDKWNQKLKEAQDSSKITDLTIAKAKVEKITPRMQTEQNQLNTFNAMAEDLKRFC